MRPGSVGRLSREIVSLTFLCEVQLPLGSRAGCGPVSSNGLVISAPGTAIGASDVTAGVDEDLRAPLTVACAEPLTSGFNCEDGQTPRSDGLGARDCAVLVGSEVEMGFHPVVSTEEGLKTAVADPV